MSKVEAPLFSINAGGTLGKKLIYCDWQKKTRVKWWGKPSDKRSSGQKEIRDCLKEAAQAWRELTWAEKKIWRRLRNYQGLKGYDLWIQWFMWFCIRDMVTPRLPNLSGGGGTDEETGTAGGGGEIIPEEGAIPLNYNGWFMYMEIWKKIQALLREGVMEISSHSRLVRAHDVYPWLEYWPEHYEGYENLLTAYDQNEGDVRSQYFGPGLITSNHLYFLVGGRKIINKFNRSNLKYIGYCDFTRQIGEPLKYWPERINSLTNFGSNIYFVDYRTARLCRINEDDIHPPPKEWMTPTPYEVIKAADLAGGDMWDGMVSCWAEGNTGYILNRRTRKIIRCGKYFGAPREEFSVDLADKTIPWKPEMIFGDQYFIYLWQKNFSSGAGDIMTLNRETLSVEQFLTIPSIVDGNIIAQCYSLTVANNYILFLIITDNPRRGGVLAIKRTNLNDYYWEVPIYTLPPGWEFASSVILSTKNKEIQIILAAEERYGMKNE